MRIDKSFGLKPEFTMLSSFSLGKRLGLFATLACTPFICCVNAALQPQGGEYSISGRRIGDQVQPSISLSTAGGFLVWQDNFVDGDGLGISAVRLTRDGLAAPSSFKVNEVGVGDQENPQVASLKGGGSVIVWQGGVYGFQDIYARFIKPDGTFYGGDLKVNSFAENQQINPVVTGLSDGNAVVVWASFGQDGHMQGVFGQIFGPSGERVGAEFQLNESTMYNQRTPSVSALAGGGFVAVWISEKSRGITTDATAPAAQAADATAGRTIFGVDVYARVFGSDGKPNGSEFLVNSGTSICANPSVAGGKNGGFLVSWGQDDAATASNSWDVYCRVFSSNGAPQSSVQRLNSFTFGDQFAPKAVGTETGYVVGWTSLGQDGSMEGVISRAVDLAGGVLAGELQVNTTTASKQIQPALAFDGAGRVVVVWSGFAVETGFDLFAQRLGELAEIPTPNVPIATALSSSRILISWPLLSGFEGVSYDVLVDDATSPIRVTGGHQILTGLSPSTSHSVKIAYVMATGQRSAYSEAASASTWGEDNNGDGLPDDWQASYWPQAAAAPGGSEDSDGDGVSNFREFLAGTNPVNPQSVLKMKVEATPQGLGVSWNTRAGSVYQLQASADSLSWTELGGPRFAAGTSDLVIVQPSNNVSLFRVIRIR